MTAKEARQEQWKKLQDQPLSAKLKYIFTYYWSAIALGAFGLIFVVTWIISAATQKDVVLTGYLLNSTTVNSYQGNMAEEFMQEQEIDTKESTVTLQSNFYFDVMDVNSLESVVTLIFAGDLDFIVSDLTSYPVLSAHFADLKTVLSEEQWEKYSPYFLYVERSALETLKTGDQGSGLKLPEYCPSSEGLEDPIALGIRIPDSNKLFDAYSFPKEDIVFGIPAASRHMPMALAFLDYLFQ